MADPQSFHDLDDEIWPRWARKPKWATFLSVLSTTKDSLAHWLASTIYNRLSKKCAADALDLVGSNLLLERGEGRLRMSDAAWRAYQAQPFSRWATAGTNAGVVNQLAAYGITATVVTWLDLANGGNPGAFGGTNTCFCYVQIDGSPFNPPGNWGDSPDPPGSWDNAPYTWDSDATAGEVEFLRRIIRRWLHGVMSCRFIKVQLTDGSYITWPMWETWEINYAMNPPAAPEFYNQGYDAP